MYESEISHRDSTGKGGSTIGPGDVQWMTTGSGILHQEFHSPDFSQLDMLQLWVNLPIRDKLTPPGYQSIVSRDIPTIPLPGNNTTQRLIAGEYQDQRGPAQTFSPMLLADITLSDGS